MAWLQVEAGLRDHPKVIKLARDIDGTVQDALGQVVSLWLWCLTHAPDGDLRSFDADDIEAVVGWTGQPGKWYAAAISRRLLDEANGRAQIHDWQDYTSSWTEAERKREWRKKGSEGTHECDGTILDIDGTKTKRPSTAPDRPTDRQTDRPTDRQTDHISSLSPQRNKRRSSQFTKPTAEEVAAYAESIGFALNGQAFTDYYESKGWLVGKSPMKDWKAAVRTWKRRRELESKPVAITAGPAPQEALDLMDHVYGPEKEAGNE